jgi:hypothetical protein
MPSLQWLGATPARRERQHEGIAKDQGSAKNAHSIICTAINWTVRRSGVFNQAESIPFH